MKVVQRNKKIRMNINEDKKLQDDYRMLKGRISFIIEEAKFISILGFTRKNKSTVVRNLAEAYSRTGKAVLIVDGDSVSGNQTSNHKDNSRVYEIDNHEEVLSLLNINKVDGNPLLSVTALVQNGYSIIDRLPKEKIIGLFEEFKKKYDYVLLDTLALNEGIDGIYLSKFTDASIMIVEENFSKSNELYKFRRIFDEAKVPLIGIVNIREE